MTQPVTTLSLFHPKIPIRMIYGWLAALSRDLLKSARLFKIFLAGLVIVFGLGLTGGLQSGLGSLGAGETGIAYAVAGMVNGGRLRPVQNEENFRLSQSGDVALQNYFVLDESTGSLRLRDGLKAIDTGSNPLQTFPLSIQRLDTKTGSERSLEANSLYIHVVDCASYLQLSQGKKAYVPSDDIDNKGSPVLIPPLPYSDAAEQVILCESKKPFFGKKSSVGKIHRWIDAKANVVPPGRPAVLSPDKSRPVSSKVPILSPQKRLYFKNLIEVFNLPPPKSIAGSRSEHRPESSWTSPYNDETMISYLQQPQQPRYGKRISQPIGAMPVTEIVLLVDNVMPGMEIYRVPQTPDDEPQILSIERQDGASAWHLRSWVLLERGLLFMLVLRIPFLVIIGIIIPVVLYFIRFQYLLVRVILKPYLLLLLAQILTMALASQVMGEGLVLWVGFGYTLLRILQLLGMLRYIRNLEYARMLRAVTAYTLMKWLTIFKFFGLARVVASMLAASRRISSTRIAGPAFLKTLLKTELILWALNGLGLFLHFGYTFWRFFDISPA